MTFHTKYPLRSSGIFEILNLLLAIPTLEAGRAKGLIAGEYSQILDLITTCAAAIGTIITDERSVAEKEKVCIRVEKCAAGITPEAVYMPSIARWEMFSIMAMPCNHVVERTKFESLSLLKDLRKTTDRQSWVLSHGGALAEDTGKADDLPRRNLCL